MRKVQAIVRDVPGVTWNKGFSKCYKDTSYTRTKKKTRFNFDRVQVDTAGKGFNCDTDPLVETITKALTDEGHKIEAVLVYDEAILIYQEIAIEIVEL